MGRPLFSSARQPAVRVQPDAQHPTYEKWTYANAFDPDSDEFFENDDAVYEAFIDPGEEIQLPPPPRTIIDVEDSSSSSEGTSSGRGSPMEVVEGVTFTRDARTSGVRIMEDTRLPVPTLRNPALDAQIDAARALPEEDRVPYFLSIIDRMEAMRQRDGEDTRLNLRHRLPPVQLDIPSPDPISRVPTPPSRPSTPPTRLTPHLVSPSPPPSVTPRLYSWSTYPGPSMPPPASPLTNRGARVSVARITTPSLVPAHRAA